MNKLPDGPQGFLNARNLSVFVVINFLRPKKKQHGEPSGHELLPPTLQGQFSGHLGRLGTLPEGVAFLGRDVPRFGGVPI